jgi:AcrR family transcriptional regulator
MADASTLDQDRRARVLDAALGVFTRYGFRKASMDEVARAADISRQGLYFLFDSKEALFREALTRMMQEGLAAMDRALAGGGPLAPRLTAAMKAWYGRSVGTMGANAEELFARSVDLVGDLMVRSGDEALRRLTVAIAASPAAETLRARGLTPEDAARTLEAVGLGLKHGGVSREVFAERAAAAVKLVAGA